MTKENFAHLKVDVKPIDVYVAATVDQGGNVVNACKSLGLDTLLCRGHRVNSSVMWALGIAGSPSKCKNPEMKKLVMKGAALVGCFSHSAVNNDALRSIQEELNDTKLAELTAIRIAASALEGANDDVDDDGIEDEDSDSDVEDASRVGRKPFTILNTIRRNDTR